MAGEHSSTGGTGGGSGTASNWQVHNHRDVSGGAARAAVFGASDGLVSNTALILGMAGAGSSSSAVLTAGLAGMLAGAVSMAAGEYVSMAAQAELVERELAIERRALERNPVGEHRELADLYVGRGLPRDLADQVAGHLMVDPTMALEVHAKEELGLHPDAVGSPLSAALSSFGAFSMGAVLPIVPWLFSGGSLGVTISVLIAVLASATVGVLLARFTERSALVASTRQVALTVGSCALTWVLGILVGSALG